MSAYGGIADAYDRLFQRWNAIPVGTLIKGNGEGMIYLGMTTNDDSKKFFKTELQFSTPDGLRSYGLLDASAFHSSIVNRVNDKGV